VRRHHSGRDPGHPRVLRRPRAPRRHAVPRGPEAVAGRLPGGPDEPITTTDLPFVARDRALVTAPIAGLWHSITTPLPIASSTSSASLNRSRDTVSRASPVRIQYAVARNR